MRPRPRSGGRVIRGHRQCAAVPVWGGPRPGPCRSEVPARLDDNGYALTVHKAQGPHPCRVRAAFRL